MSDLIPVEGHKGLRRDSQTLGIVNTDKEALEIAKRRRNKAKANEQAISELQSEMSEMKGILKEILRNIQNG